MPRSRKPSIVHTVDSRILIRHADQACQTAIDSDKQNGLDTVEHALEIVYRLSEHDPLPLVRKSAFPAKTALPLNNAL